MRRILTAVLPLLLLPLAACASTAPTAPLDPIALDPTPALQEDARRGPGFGDYAMVVPENLAWVPWKILGTTGKGIYDGVATSFSPGRLPILGLVFMPVNAVVGAATGLGTGVVSKPVFIGPRDQFARTMNLPLQRPTPVWWLPQ